MQDCWLRLPGAPPDLLSARAWLTRVVTRLCLDRLKAARTEREQYIGSWLPEPVPAESMESAEDIAARRESITMAFLVLLETLTPAERAAFLLREVFDVDYHEIASALETTPAAVRQLVHRAKARVTEGRPRFQPEPERHRAIASKFLEAIKLGDLAGLQQYLTQDVVYTADGGGKAAASLRPISGADAVARLMIGLWQKSIPLVEPNLAAWHMAFSTLNEEPALLVWLHGRLDSVMILSIETDQITAIRVVRNPEKLKWLESHAQVPQ